MRAWAYVWRPYWADHPRTSRPDGGWHLVAESQRWHFYAAHGVGTDYVLWRFCDDAESVHPRLPRLINGDLVAPRRGHAICPTCWAVWERVRALPDNGFGGTTIGGGCWAHAGNLSATPGPGSPTLTCMGGLT